MDRAFTAIECAALPKRMVYADSEDQGRSGCPKGGGRGALAGAVISKLGTVPISRQVSQFEPAGVLIHVADPSVQFCTDCRCQWAQTP
jgi:hypothetical protein